MQVKWDDIDPAKYATIGEFEVLGTVDGTTIKAKCTVKVRDKIVASAENVTVVTTVGAAPQMPVKVKVKYNDGTIGEEIVNWDVFSDEKWQQAGKFTVDGKIEGTEIKVTCTVRVDDPNETLLVNIEPEKSVALEPVQKGTYTLNGVVYEDSIFAHAKSELVYVLGGNYTRFTTTVGVKQMGDNPNVLFRGYGISAEGTETLLYETTPVSRVVDPSADPQTAEKTTGYYYVGGNVSYYVDVDVTGFEKIKLVADEVGNANTDHSVYGSPKLYTADSVTGKNFHTITVTSESGGALWPNGRVVVPNGESKTFTITPAPENTLRPDLNVEGMKLGSLKLDDLSQTVEDKSFTMPAGSVTITATYKNQPAPTYALTVASGTGTGSYEAGTVVDITASGAPVGKVFDKWTTSGGGTFADATNATTTFTMPAGSVTVTATYKAKPVIEEPTYTLTVVSGTGTGSYEAGTVVDITASGAPVGKVFDKWTTSGGGTFADATNATTTFTMPAGSVTVTATYKAKPVIEEPTYTLTVVSGTGTGSYEAGKVVSITASKAPAGKIFDKWTTSGGGSFARVANATTTFTMPAGSVTVTATYKAKPVIEEPTYTLTVVSGTGTGSYEAGKVVSITASKAPAGKIFDKWTTSGGGSFARVANATTTFTMPAGSVTVTATYKAKPVIEEPTYTLTVVSGTGTGSYEAGKVVSITASKAPAGKIFDKWTTSGGGSFARVANANTTFTMPAGSVTITATYKAKATTGNQGGSSGGRSGSGASPNIPNAANASGKVNAPYKPGETIVGKETVTDGKSATTVISMAPRATSRDNPAVAGSKAAEETKYTIENFKKDLGVAQKNNKDTTAVLIGVIIVKKGA